MHAHMSQHWSNIEYKTLDFAPSLTYCYFVCMSHGREHEKLHNVPLYSSQNLSKPSPTDVHCICVYYIL